ncbi:unnamed protein product [Adineta steineri]|uniref:Uncharacterized protein n=1 Tax=Adineta steineri TaxID=433720 RepID=A0A819XTY7_9BILA|nr:unnamed protein product [Adineta steineri]
MSTAYQVFSWLSYIIGLFSFVFAIYVIPSNYWLEENFKSGLIITSTQAGLWKWCSYKVLTELSCDSLTKLDSRFRAAQALCVLGALVINLLAIAIGIFSNLSNDIRLKNWKIKAAVVLLYLIASLFTIVGILDYLNLFLYMQIATHFHLSISIGYSFIFMVCAALLTGLCAVLYGITVGYNFEKKEINRLVSVLMMAAGTFAVITAFISVISPIWLKYVSSTTGEVSTASLWEYCVKNRATGERKCSKIVDVMLNGQKFRSVQHLAIASLVFLIISGLLICATFFQYLIVLFHTTPEAKPQLQSDYGLSIMIFIATASGVAGVIQSIVLGCQMASASI